MAEKTVENAAEEKKYVSYCIPGTFIDQKLADVLNAKHPEKKPCVVIHTRKPDRGINWEESLVFSANKNNGNPRLSPMTVEQKEKQGLDKEKDYYIVNFEEKRTGKLYINKRTGTDDQGKGIYEKTIKDLSAEEFSKTMKQLEPWHREKAKTAEQAAEKTPEKAVEKKAEEKAAVKEEAKAKAPVKKTVAKKATKEKEAATKKRGARQS